MSFATGFGNAWAGAAGANWGDTAAFAGIGQESIRGKALRDVAEIGASADRLGAGLNAAVGIVQAGSNLAGNVFDSKTRERTALTMLDKQIAADERGAKRRGLGLAAAGAVQAAGALFMPKIKVPEVSLEKLPMVEVPRLPSGMSTTRRTA